MKKLIKPLKPVEVESLPSYKELKLLTTKLQELLHIQDWIIDLRVVDDAGMFYVARQENVLGYCIRHRTSNTASIFINSDRGLDSWYFTLLHELYHVVTDEYVSVLDNLEGDYVPEEYREGIHSNNCIAYERLVNKLARTFSNIYPYSKLKGDL